MMMMMLPRRPLVVIKVGKRWQCELNANEQWKSGQFADRWPTNSLSTSSIGQDICRPTEASHMKSLQLYSVGNPPIEPFGQPKVKLEAMDESQQSQEVRPRSNEGQVERAQLAGDQKNNDDDDGTSLAPPPKALRAAALDKFTRLIDRLELGSVTRPDSSRFYKTRRQEMDAAISLCLFGRLVLLSLLLLLWTVYGCGTRRAVALAATKSSSSAKLVFWAQLLESALHEDANSDKINLMARKLYEWPDQRRAALFYMHLLARRQMSKQPTDTCRRASLAELSATSDRFPRPAAENDSVLGQAAHVSLNELGGLETADNVIKRRLDQEDQAQLVRLAVENANLISKLLIQREQSEDIRRLSSQRFFKYLLESKVQHLMSVQVNPRPPTDKPHQLRLHSAGLVFLAPDRLDSESQTGGWSVVTAPLVLASGGAPLDLATHHVAGNSSHTNAYFGPNSWQPFVARWLLADRWGQLDPIKRRLATSSQTDGPLPADRQEDGVLSYTDGRWFSPYLDCGVTQHWLLTYSVPFFASDPASNQPADETNIKLSGVAFVSADVTRSGLWDQCDGPAFLANTHQCARLQGSQCKSLAAEDEQPLSGAYVCLCPTGAHLSAADRAASEEKRESLEDLTLRRVADNQTSSLIELAFELDDQLTDPSRVASTLTAGGPNKKQKIAQRRHFVLGAQLEQDAQLQWITLGQSEPLYWPPMACTLCDHQLQSAGADFDNKSIQPQTDHLCSKLTGPSSSMSWLKLAFLAPVQATCVLLTLFLIAALVRFRKSRIILASGWLMLETILVGALLLYLSVLVKLVDPPNSLSCLMEPWLRELGFSIFYGSILIKLYRILTEFQTRKAHRVCLRDKDQMIYLLAIVLIVIGYMSAWTALMVDGFYFATDQQSVSANATSDGSSAFNVSAGSIRSLLLFNQSGDESDRPPRRSVGQDDGDELRTKLALAVDRLASYAAQNFHSFGDLFSGLMINHQHYDSASGALVYSIRCRLLTWDYITELSEMGLLLFGIHLVYKLRNASSEVHREKLVLSAAVFIELIVSLTTYLVRHAFWQQLDEQQLLWLFFVRCQLTVTLASGLIFWPKIDAIRQNKPSLFGGFRGNAGAANTGSMRHRCHISCELHDHHLNDAMRLHQAMLSNAALEIGSINLADMDPDEIQAELKRVYAQLEVLKTKAMRRDNPHISKRRGGRKTGHRKFSLQAFHAKHLAHHGSSTSAANPSGSGTLAATGGSLAQVDEDGGETRQLLAIKPLPVLEELDTQQQAMGVNSNGLPDATSYSDSQHQQSGKQWRRVRMEEQADNDAKSSRAGKRHQHTNNHSRGHHHHKHHHHHQHGKANQAMRPQAVAGSIVPEPASTSSTAVYFDDSQSSDDNTSPQRQSSFACSQSSIIHPEGSSVN